MLTSDTTCPFLSISPPNDNSESISSLLLPLPALTLHAHARYSRFAAGRDNSAVDEREPTAEQREIDALLARYEREVEYFVLTRDRLLPLMRQLLDALREWARSGEDADGRAAMLRREYITELNALGGQIDDWVRIRGSGLRVSSLAGGMSDEQIERFSALQSREVAEALGREEFDAAQAELRELLLIFEEFAG